MKPCTLPGYTGSLRWLLFLAIIIAPQTVKPQSLNEGASQPGSTMISGSTGNTRRTSQT